MKPHPTFNDGIMLRKGPDGLWIWMVKKNPGVYFYPPQEGKPLVYATEDAADDAGFEIEAHKRERRITARLAVKRREVEIEIQREMLDAEFEESPPFRSMHRGNGVYQVIEVATGDEQSQERLTKPQSEELCEIKNREAKQARIAAAAASIESPAEARASAA